MGKVHSEIHADMSKKSSLLFDSAIKPQFVALDLNLNALKLKIEDEKPEKISDDDTSLLKEVIFDYGKINALDKYVSKYKDAIASNVKEIMTKLRVRQIGGYRIVEKEGSERIDAQKVHKIMAELKKLAATKNQPLDSIMAKILELSQTQYIVKGESSFALTAVSEEFIELLMDGETFKSK